MDAFDSHDIDRLLTYDTDDAFYEDVPSVENGWDVPLRGHQMIRESVARGFEEMSDLGFEFVSASSAGDRMVVEWIMTGTHYRDFTGRFSIRGVSVIKLEGDKIASVSDYYDAYLFLSQMGWYPPWTWNGQKRQGFPDSVTWHPLVEPSEEPAAGAAPRLPSCFLGGADWQVAQGRSTRTISWRSSPGANPFVTTCVVSKPRFS